MNKQQQTLDTKSISRITNIINSCVTMEQLGYAGRWLMSVIKRHKFTPVQMKLIRNTYRIKRYRLLKCIDCFDEITRSDEYKSRGA